MNVDHLNLQKVIVGDVSICAYMRVPGAELLTDGQWIDLHKVRGSHFLEFARSVWVEQRLDIATRSFFARSAIPTHLFDTVFLCETGWVENSAVKHNTFEEAMAYHEEIARAIVDRVDNVETQDINLVLQDGAL